MSSGQPVAAVVAVAVALCLLTGAGESSTSRQYRYPLKLSHDGSYLVDQNETPFFINGDTAWSLIAAVSKEDAELYLEDRRRKGFNLVLVSLIERKFAPNAPANHYGKPPFTTPGDLTTPNEEYFAHADWVLERAHAKGIAVLLAPLYLGYGCGDEGWCAEVKTSSVAAMQRYGRYLGERYRDARNIVWLIGGDVDPFGRPPIRNWRGTVRQLLTDLIAGGGDRSNDVADKVRAVVAGLREHDRSHLMSAHNGTEQSAVDAWPNEGWLDLNNVYTYGHAYVKAREQFKRRPFKPFFLVETFYENAADTTLLAVRRQAYWSILSGGTLGHIFGNCQIWGFSHGFCPDPWKPQLNSPGSTSLANAGRLFMSRAFFRLVPDHAHRILTSGYGDGDSYAAAAYAGDGSTIIAYIPTRRTVTLDLTRLAGPAARAWWFDPRTGRASAIGTYRSQRGVSFTVPDESDRVLVIDNASLNLPAPGLLETTVKQE
jgi:hypothetical protein